MTNPIDTLRERVAASQAAVDQAFAQLTAAKADAITARINRQAVDALVVSKVLFTVDPEVVAARAADEASAESVLAARRAVRTTVEAHAARKLELFDAEQPAQLAREQADRARRMAWVEKNEPGLLDEVRAARDELHHATTDGTTWKTRPHSSSRQTAARERLNKLETELKQRLASAPDDPGGTE